MQCDIFLEENSKLTPIPVENHIYIQPLRKNYVSKSKNCERNSTN